MTLDPSPITPDELRAILAQLKLSQAALARRIGVSEGTMSGWVNGVAPCKGPASALLRVMSKKHACPSMDEGAQ